MRLALFDFDGTLTRRDSLMPFLRHVGGTPRFASGLLQMSPVLGAYALGRLPNHVAKERVLAHFLGGRALADVQRLGTTFAQERVPALLRADTQARLQTHLARGDVCVLVSASLDVYLQPWAAQQGFEAVLCSSLVSTRDGRVTGALDGANCFGPEKVRRVLAWLGTRVPEHITAYGDSRGDTEMLAMAHTPVRV